MKLCDLELGTGWYTTVAERDHRDHRDHRVVKSSGIILITKIFFLIVWYW